MSTDTPVESLSLQSGLPAQHLITFERMGLIDASHYEIASNEERSSILERAKHILGLRQLGFSLEQIVALLDAEDVQ